MKVEWEQEFAAMVASNDEAVCGRLKFNVEAVEWNITELPTDDLVLDGREPTGRETIDPDPDRREALLHDRMQIAGYTQAAQNALVAEWEGRVRMFAEETREMALLGAQVKLRKWRRRV